MSATTTILMQGPMREESSSRKQPLRLPIIAPKDEASSSTSTNRSGAPAAGGSHVTPRTRLPPRSRTGCWTCRTRKVKCDEGRPVCGQCVRLGHTCDYNPRLSFRNDTQRVVERMQDITTAGSSVWDRQYRSMATAVRRTDSSSATSLTPTDSGGSAEPGAVDDLPPFASLTTDEERERKAERTSPGTYNVVVNPDSFQHIPEYSDDPEVRSQRQSPLRRGSLAWSLSSSLGRESQLDGRGTSLVTTDPNIVVLARFEDIARRAAGQWKEAKSHASPSAPVSSIKTEETEWPTLMEAPDAPPSLIAIAEQGGADAQYLEQFRHVVWPQLVQLEFNEHEDSKLAIGSSADVVEEVAAYFPPLFHAMMAIAAISLSQRESAARLDALQHYQKALPALQSLLRSAEDLSSDGGFLTHFLFLVYEIAAADSDHSDHMWSQHLSTLLRTSLLRREVFGGERYPFITWWICNIDLYALLSGVAGSGEFVGTLLKNDMIPPPQFHLCPLGMDGSSIILPDERDSLPVLLQLNYEVTLLAVRLGLLARELRQEAAFDAALDATHPQRHLDTRLRQVRVYALQESLHQLCTAPAFHLSNTTSLPSRARHLSNQTTTLSHATLIYSHTSMWPTQRLDTAPTGENEIAHSASLILHTAHHLISSYSSSSSSPADHCRLRYLVFPLFIAGFASTDGEQKKLALDLIQRLEGDASGGGGGANTTGTAVRRALETVYAQQTGRFMSTGHSLDIGWLEVLGEISGGGGAGVVGFGL